MTARKAIFGLCAVCAMLFSAFAAQSAMAVNQSGVTCTNTGTQIPGTEKFTKENCKSEDKSPSGSFYHVAYSGKTVGKLSNNTTAGAKQSGFLKATIGGLETIIE